LKYIVNVSGGLTSFEALRRTLEKHGKDNTHAVFADTLIEDEDLYRFLDDQERYFDIKIERIADGRTPWQVMKDSRCIKLPRIDMAPCSKALKRQAIDRAVNARYAEGEYTRVFGMDWTEMHRIDRLTAALDPEPVWFPLIEKPFVDKCQIAAFLEAIGIKVPRLYSLGFTHNNCGGGCVKAGQAHWARLWQTMPERYLLWEAKEQEIREHLGKDVTILRMHRNKQFHKVTLKEFRERLESGDTQYDKDDWGGCGCFIASL
jgi:3'-phosphoadenosine 5'-phosphosulfate sulfotransferase (PAPS reductase)/FAD synthetase